MKVLVTGSSGRIGSEAVRYFDERGARVYGIDNNMRADFFGPEGDTTWNLRRLQETCRRFDHHSLDIRDRAAMAKTGVFRGGCLTGPNQSAVQPRGAGARRLLHLLHHRPDQVPQPLSWLGPDLRPRRHP